MIKLANQVPSIYPSASRDFQYLCWLFDIVLNSVKHNVDDLYALPNSQADYKLTELLATTLGFKVKRNYDQAQLRALVAALPRILKYKGTKLAVDMAGSALLSASGASGSYSSRIIDCELYVVFPETLIDISLFTDLLTYILPAGMTCHIERTNIITAVPKTNFDYADKLIAEWLPDVAYDDETGSVGGLAELADIPKENPSFANFYTENSEKDYRENVPNIGLLDNNVIPSFDNSPIVIMPDDATKANEQGDI